MAKWGRRIAAVAIGLSATLALLFGIIFTWMAFDTSSAQTEQKVLRDFRKIEVAVNDYRSKTGNIPDEDRLRDLATGITLEHTYAELLHIDRDPSEDRFFADCFDHTHFVPAQGDKFTLGIWRGEWLDCYASPSGRSTLEPSEAFWRKHNLQMFGPVALGLLVVSAAFFFGASKLFRRRK